MALLDRTQERVPSDLSEGEIGSLIAEAQAEIRARWGPDRSTADPPDPISTTREGRRRKLDIARPIDADEDIVVTEYVSAWGLGETATVLAADDYRVWNGGRTLERLATGTNARSRWGDEVEVDYVPVDDTAQRDEVVIKLVQLAVEYRGLSSERVGDVAKSMPDHDAEREKLIASLSPRKGLLIA